MNCNSIAKKKKRKQEKKSERDRERDRERKLSNSSTYRCKHCLVRLDKTGKLSKAPDLRPEFWK